MKASTDVEAFFAFKPFLISGGVLFFLAEPNSKALVKEIGVREIPRMLFNNLCKKLKETYAFIRKRYN